jgi:hypothetical protein
MRHNREETAPQDPPGGLCHTQPQLQIFSVPAVLDLFTGLQGPKSLLVQIGDQGNGELP